MDSVFLTKVLTHLAYPASIIGICFLLSIIFLVFGKSVKASLAMILGTTVYLLASNPQFSNHIISQLEYKYPQLTLEKTPNADAIIVLGGSIRPPSFPRQYTQLSGTSDRFWHAARLFNAKKANKIVLLGGNIYENNNIKPEAVYVKESLVRLGIPKNAVIIETQSRTTKENQENSNNLLAENKIESALLVTSALHMPRALREFENASIQIIPISSDTIIAHNNQPSIFNWIPNANAFANSTRALHEYYGIMAQQGADLGKDFINYLKRPAQQTASR